MSPPSSENICMAQDISSLDIFKLINTQLEETVSDVYKYNPSTMLSSNTITINNIPKRLVCDGKVGPFKLYHNNRTIINNVNVLTNNKVSFLLSDAPTTLTKGDLLVFVYNPNITESCNDFKDSLTKSIHKVNVHLFKSIHIVNDILVDKTSGTDTTTIDDNLLLLLGELVDTYYNYNGVSINTIDINIKVASDKFSLQETINNIIIRYKRKVDA